MRPIFYSILSVLFNICILPGIIFSQPIQLEDSCWIRKGPNSAHIQSLAIAPSNPDIIYIGTYSTGVYKSIDGGESWIQCSRFNLPEYEDTLLNSPSSPCWWFGDYYPIEDIAVDPTDANHLWIGTVERGLFESIDGGNTWIKANSTLPDTLAVNFININPTNTDNILLGTGSYFTVGSPQNGGLYRTDNGGINWHLVEDVPHGETYQVTGITRNPSDNNHLYVGINSAGVPGFSWGLFESLDNGLSWQICTDFYPLYDVVVNPANNDSLWGILYSWLDNWVLCYSIDGGFNWDAYYGFPSNELWVVSLYADPDFNLYIQRVNEELGEYNILKSEDNGINWLNVDYPTGGFNTISLRKKFKASSANSEETFFGTYYGISYSNDGGNSSEMKNTGLMNSYIYDVEVNPQNPNIIYAGGPQGLWKSYNGGKEWQQKYDKGILYIKIDPIHPDTIYFGRNKDLFRSFDGCENYENIYNNLSLYLSDIKINPINTNIVYTATTSYYTKHVYKSFDHGNTWVQILTDNYGRPETKIILDPGHPDTLYFGEHRSVNGGVSWDENVLDYRVIGVHPFNSNIIYATDDFGNEIYVSYDWGEYFNKIDGYYTGPFTDYNIKNFCISQDNPDYLFYCTLNNGIHYSYDAGENWDRFPGIYNNRTLDIEPSVSDNKYIIATHGDGVWIYDSINSNVNIQKYEQSEHISINVFPNPCNSNTQISVEFAGEIVLSVQIYNILGKPISRLVEMQTSRSPVELTWNCKDTYNNCLNPGIYILYLQTNKGNYTKSIVVTN